MTKALVVDIIIPVEEYDSVFKKVFGIVSRTIIAEDAMRRLNGYCYLCPEDDCIFGDYPRTKEKLKRYDTIIYLSHLFKDYDIGSM